MKNSLKSTLLGANPILFLEQSRAMKCYKKIGSPKITRLLKVFLIFKTIFLLCSLRTNFQSLTLIFLASKEKKMLFSLSFQNFFLFAAVHSMQYVLLFTAQFTSFDMNFPKTLVIADSGSPMYEALSVNTADSSSGTSPSVSYSLSYIPMSFNLGSLPNPYSSTISIHSMLLQPFQVYLAVMSPIVMVSLAPMNSVTVFSVALTQVNISLRKEFSEAWSNLSEIAPSLKTLRLSLISVALIKLVLISWRVSFSPQMKRPSIISSKKLLSLLESLAMKVMFFDFSNSPRMIEEEPQMMASSLSSSYFFLCNLFEIFFLVSLTFSAKVSTFLPHLCPEPQILHSGALIQLRGMVRSIDMNMC